MCVLPWSVSDDSTSSRIWRRNRMSTLEKGEKRRFAKNLRAVGTAATIRESVVKDLRENSVLVRRLALHILPVLLEMYSAVALTGGSACLDYLARGY